MPWLTRTPPVVLGRVGRVIGLVPRPRPMMSAKRSARLLRVVPGNWATPPAHTRRSPSNGVPHQRRRLGQPDCDRRQQTGRCGQAQVGARLARLRTGRRRKLAKGSSISRRLVGHDDGARGGEHAAATLADRDLSIGDLRPGDAAQLASLAKHVHAIRDFLRYSGR